VQEWLHQLWLTLINVVFVLGVLGIVGQAWLKSLFDKALEKRKSELQQDLEILRTSLQAVEFRKQAKFAKLNEKQALVYGELFSLVSRTFRCLGLSNNRSHCSSNNERRVTRTA
jgi:hypothetical protein